MESLEHCNYELSTLRNRVSEWMEDEEEETPLYRDLENLLGFIGVALDAVDLLSLEEKLTGADEDDINDLVIHVDWVRNVYRQLL